MSLNFLSSSFFTRIVISISFTAITISRILIVTTIKYGGDWNEIKRNTGIRFIRWLTDTFSPPQLQCLVPSTVTTYKLWSKLRGMPVTVENLMDGTSLVWIGPKRTNKVILYIHGKHPLIEIRCVYHEFFLGGFLLFPVLPNYLELWRYVQLQLAKSDREVGVAVLAYCTFNLLILKTRKSLTFSSSLSDCCIPDTAPSSGSRNRASCRYWCASKQPSSRGQLRWCSDCSLARFAHLTSSGNTFQFFDTRGRSKERSSIEAARSYPWFLPHVSLGLHCQVKTFTHVRPAT